MTSAYAVDFLLDQDVHIRKTVVKLERLAPEESKVYKEVTDQQMLCAIRLRCPFPVQNQLLVTGTSRIYKKIESSYANLLRICVKYFHDPFILTHILDATIHSSVFSPYSVFEITKERVQYYSLERELRWAIADTASLLRVAVINPRSSQQLSKIFKCESHVDFEDHNSPACEVGLLKDTPVKLLVHFHDCPKCHLDALIQEFKFDIVFIFVDKCDDFEEDRVRYVGIPRIVVVADDFEGDSVTDDNGTYYFSPSTSPKNILSVFVDLPLTQHDLRSDCNDEMFRNISLLDGFCAKSLSCATNPFVFQALLHRYHALERKRILNLDSSVGQKCTVDMDRLKDESTTIGNLPENPILDEFIAFLSDEDGLRRPLLLYQLRKFLIKGGTCVPGDKWPYSIDLLWREMSSMYFFQQESFANYPTLAAQYLLDGFPLEIVDGIEAQVNEVWFRDVMSALHNMALAAIGHEPRIICIAAMGVESAGKSTILNRAFGAELRTHELRCTQGVSMQLVRCTRPGCDYVVVLDVEGIRSASSDDDVERTTRDNRLCSFAFFLSHQTLFVYSNGTDAVRETLSVLRGISEGTAMAFTKPYFVVNRFDNDEHVSEKLTIDNRALKLDANKNVNLTVDDFCFLPSVTDRSQAGKFASRILALMGRLHERHAPATMTFTEFTSKAQQVRQQILSVEKNYLVHGSLRDKQLRDAAVESEQHWRIEVGKIYKDQVVELEVQLDEIVAGVKILVNWVKANSTSQLPQDFWGNTPLSEDIKRELHTFVLGRESQLTPAIEEVAVLAVHKLLHTRTDIAVSALIRGDRDRSYLEVYALYFKVAEADRQETLSTVANVVKSHYEVRLSSAVRSSEFQKTRYADCVDLLLRSARQSRSVSQNLVLDDSVLNNFNVLFDACLETEEKTLRDVKKLVEDFFHDKGVSRPASVLSFSESTPNVSYSRSTILGSIFGRRNETQDESKHQADQQRIRKFQRVKDECVAYVQDLISTAARDSQSMTFCEGDLSTHFGFLSRLVKNLSINDQNIVYDSVIPLLATYYALCEERWAQLHHPYHKLEANKALIFQTFVGFLKGEQI